MQYAITDVGSQVRVSLSGALTFRDGPALRAVIQAMEEPWVKEMVVDMAAVPTMDHASLGLMRDWIGRAQRQEVSLRLHGLDEGLRQRLGHDTPVEVLAAE